MLEDLGPFFDFLDVILHIFALNESRRQHCGEIAQFFQRVDDVLSLKGDDNFLGLSCDALTILEAIRDLKEVVVTGQSKKDTSDEVRDRSGIDTVCH